jgi:hypothetical protein
MEKVLEPHLGGHLNKTHIDRGTLLYLQKTFGVKTMLDIGCGPGDMYHVAKELGIEWMGMDGDDVIVRDPEIEAKVTICDFSKSAAPVWRMPYGTLDLAWSVEFLEHVEEQYVPNFMLAFAYCKYAIVTAAPPGYPGHHHVNCRLPDYWIGVFAANGFKYNHKHSVQIRQYESTMKKPFMQKNGMFFERF